MRMIHCSKLKKELEGLERPTYPGEIGKRILITSLRKLGAYG